MTSSRGPAAVVRARRAVIQGRVEENVSVVVGRDGCIAAVTRDEVKGADNVYTCDVLVPGFVDIHNHGLGGDDDAAFHWRNPDYSTVRLAEEGVTSVIASVMFPPQQMNAALETCDVINTALHQSGKGCIIRGIHAEGPIIADLGALPDPEGIVRWSIHKFEHKLVRRMQPGLRIMTISPSLEHTHGCQRIQTLQRYKCTPALGHDRNCTKEAVLGALRFSRHKTPMHITHAFNVMRFHHRDAGLGNMVHLPHFPSQYGIEQAPSIELIGDMVHVDDTVILGALAARSRDDVAFVSDAISDAVPNKQVHLLNHHNCRVSPTGETVVAGGILCGSCISLHATFCNLVNKLGQSIEDASVMCSTTPARIAQIGNVVGDIAIGKRADLVLLNDGPEFTVLHTLIGGVEFIRRVSK